MAEITQARGQEGRGIDVKTQPDESRRLQAVVLAGDVNKLETSDCSGGGAICVQRGSVMSPLKLHRSASDSPGLSCVREIGAPGGPTATLTSLKARPPKIPAQHLS